LDRIAEKQALDDQIRTAEGAAQYLRDLEAQRDRLPALKLERERRQLTEAAHLQVATATAHARAALGEAGDELGDCRARFTALAADLAALAKDIGAAQRKVWSAAAELGDAARVEVGAAYHGRTNTDDPHADDRDVYLALVSRFGEMWTDVGATSWRLLAFPGADTRLDHALITAVSNAAGERIYHPGHPELGNPFSRSW